MPEPNTPPVATPPASTPPEGSIIFLTQKEKDDFLNTERGKIREQEEKKLKDKLTSLQDQLKSKGDTSMTEEQIAQIVQKTLQSELEKSSGEITKKYSTLEKQVQDDAKQRKIERLQDILDIERGRYPEDELLESALPQTLTGTESPAEIRAAVKKAHEEYKAVADRVAAKLKAENPPKEEEKKEEEQKKTEEPPATPPAGTAAPGTTAPATSQIPPSLDNQTEEQRLMSEMENMSPEEYAQNRHKFANIFGKITR